MTGANLARLNRILPRENGPGWRDRGTVLVSRAVAIMLGATSMSDIGLLTTNGASSLNEA